MPMRWSRGNPERSSKDCRFLLARGRWWNRRVGYSKSTQCRQLRLGVMATAGEGCLPLVSRPPSDRLRRRAERGHGAFGIE